MSKLSVVKASAGSGKTYKLAYEYVKLVVKDPQGYKHILAVTFTNKATAEMKHRVLDELYQLSLGKKSNYLDALKSELEITEQQVTSRAKAALLNMLHNYSRFTIETIDSFFQRIIRGFSREMGLNTGMQIELNTNSILENSVDMLLKDVQHNKALKKWLSDYVQGKVEEGKSWAVRNEIINLGKEIYKETFQTNGQRIVDKVSDRDFMNTYRSKLHALVTNYKNTIKTIGAEAIQVMEAEGLTIDDFSYGKNGVSGFFQGAKDGTKLELSKRASDFITNPASAIAKKNPRLNELLSFAESYWVPLLIQFQSVYEKEFIAYQTADLILQHLYTLGLIVDIQKYAEEYTRSEDLFAIGDTGVFLKTIIGDNDTPFIYEKTGNYFHHFMIDEFQDTSVVQYENFKPLLENSLSQNYSNLLVGDIKQAIYRFRNTNWEVLANKVNEEFSAFINNEVLKSNWRSQWEVVTFNNAMFENLPGMLQQELNAQLEEGILPQEVKTNFQQIIPHIYKQAAQKCEKADRKGYVRFSQLQAEDKEEHHDLLLQQVCELQDAGLAAADIAILARTNGEAREIVHYFIDKQTEITAYNLTIVSAEALLLTHSPAVNLLVSSLSYLLDPKDVLTNFEIYNYLDDLHFFKATMENHARYQEEIRTLLQSVNDKYRRLSLFELTAEFIQLYGLNDHTTSWNYLFAFQDLVLEFQNRNGSDLQRFLEYWKSDGVNKTVPPGHGQDAIQVITVHKSKGLEFKAVIVPFCDWDLDHKPFHTNFIWCQPNEDPFNELALIPVSYQKKMAQSYFAVEYYYEKLKAYVDNLNLLYVALTRARDVLIINTPKGKETKGKKELKTVGQLLEMGVHAIPNAEIVEAGTMTHFAFGSLESLTSTSSEKTEVGITPELLQNQQVNKKLKMALSGKNFFNEKLAANAAQRARGTLLHEVFSNLQYATQLQAVLKDAAIGGLITNEEAGVLEATIRKKINENTLLTQWFSNEVKIYNEKDIFIPGGQKIRPDRLIQTKNELIILDFKFGTTKSPGDVEQVRNYMQQLQQMNMGKVQGYLWYFYLNALEEVNDEQAGTNKTEQLSIW